MNARTLAVLVVTVLLSGCASYTPSLAPVPQPTVKQWVVEGTVAVAADPYVEPERQRAVFDAELGKAGVIAVQVVAENRADRAVLLRPSDMILEFPDGSQLSPSGVTTVVNKVGESGSVVGAALACGLVGAIVASNAEEEARSARTGDYRDKAFKETTLGENDSAHGFVFFVPPSGAQLFADAILKVRFVDLDTAVTETVDVEISGLRYGADDATEESEKEDSAVD